MKGLLLPARHWQELGEWREQRRLEAEERADLNERASAKTCSDLHVQHMLSTVQLTLQVLTSAACVSF